MKSAEIKEMSVADLEERIAASKANLLKAKMEQAVSPSDDLHNIKNQRRDIARMLTILTQKKNSK